jgi:septal ring factor EnvC (AmiA/AmiB activator)
MEWIDKIKNALVNLKGDAGTPAESPQPQSAAPVGSISQAAFDAHVSFVATGMEALGAAVTELVNQQKKITDTLATNSSSVAELKTNLASVTQDNKTISTNLTSTSEKLQQMNKDFAASLNEIKAFVSAPPAATNTLGESVGSTAETPANVDDDTIVATNGAI